MKKFSITIIIFLILYCLVWALSSCKKDTPPVPRDDVYFAEIEITDNSPFGDAALLLALADEKFLSSGNGLAEEDTSVWIFIGDTPVYTERTFIRVVPNHIPIYLWLVTSESPGNLYSVEIFRNGTPVYKWVGSTITEEKIKI